tara:strand:+ start:707 stop:988 length:282 start_codon:yes stop_codon:yes gene_type:complete
MAYRINRDYDRIKKILGTGKISYVEFYKKDGSLRKMLGRTGVKKDVTGEGLKFNPKEKNLLVFRDVQKQAHRMINVDTIQTIKAQGIEYEVLN